MGKEINYHNIKVIQMTDNQHDDKEIVPLGQRLLEEPFILLFVGTVIFLVSYTAWGAFEIMSLQPSPLP